MRPKVGVHGWTLLTAVALSMIWSLLGWVFAITQQAQFLKILAIADVVRIAAWYCFFLSLIVGRGGARELTQLRGLIFIAVALVLTGLLAQTDLALQWNLFGSAARLALLDTLGMAVFALVLLETLLRNLPADFRWNVKPLFLGLVVAFSFDVFLYSEALLFNRIDADAMSVRGIVHALAIIPIAVTASRNGEWRLPISLSRRVVFHSTALLASGIYLLFMAAAGYYVRYFGGEWGRAFQIALVFGGLLLLGALIISGAVRAKLKVLVSKHFFSYRYDYREEWLRFTHTLSACDDEVALGQQIIRGLADMVESPGGALWLRGASSGRYAQSARWNMPASSAVDEADSAIANFLKNSGWVINLQEYRSFPGRYSELSIPTWLGEVQNAWLIVPLFSSEALIGFVVLATPRTTVDVNWEVNDLLKTAGRQAASFLQRMEASEALLEVRKFDAFNRMSAFVVHDLKNIIAQLSLMLKNASRHKDNPEFQQDMLMTVSNSVDRMKQLMMQLREVTTPVDAPRGVDLAEMIRRIHRAKAGQQPIPELDLKAGVMARGHPDRIERVIGHLVQNAIDATARDGRVWVKLGQEDNQAVIEVGNTGHGMSAEFVRDSLFKPFQSTKRTGMGIGAYESQQYVHELGGRILVESTVTVGTRFGFSYPYTTAAKLLKSGQDKPQHDRSATPIAHWEDDPALQKQIRWAFDSYETLLAAGREEALTQNRSPCASRCHNGPRASARAH